MAGLRSALARLAGRSSVRSLVITGLMIAAVGVTSSLRDGPPSLGFAPDGLVEAWNLAAPDPLDIGDLQWTDAETGTFGFAFTPTLSVVGRVNGPLGEVSELVVVGEPEKDRLFIEAASLLVAVVAPELDAGERSDLAALLGLDDGYRPASVDATVDESLDSGRVRFRVTSSADRLGVGAAALSG